MNGTTWLGLTKGRLVNEYFTTSTTYRRALPDEQGSFEANVVVNNKLQKMKLVPE